jgi:ferredoxin
VKGNPVKENPVRENPVREKLLVNPIACQRHGACAELLPEMIGLDEWGYPLIDGRAVPPALLKDARAAVSACPKLALRLVVVDAI